MIGTIAAYLNSLGILPPIGIEYLPEKPDACAGLFTWDCPDDGDGTSTRFVQVRVRDTSLESAMDTCNAILALIDSEREEKPLPVLWKGKPIIGTVRRRPILYDRDAARVTVYAEVALWGQI